MSILQANNDGTVQATDDGVAYEAPAPEIACAGCCGFCCNADCLELTFTDWPVTPSGLSDYLESAGPWFLKRRGNSCWFDLWCDINETIEGVHYIAIMMTAILAVRPTGEIYVYWFTGRFIDDTFASVPLPSVDTFHDDTAADLPGCDQIIHAKIGDGSMFPDAVLDVEVIHDADCGQEGCVENGCDTCCPDATCIQVHFEITYDYDDPDTDDLSYSFDFPLVRGTNDGIGGCWYHGLCRHEDGTYDYEALAHVVCDEDGDPQLVFFDFVHYPTGGAPGSGFVLGDSQEISCSGSTSLSFDDFVIAPPTPGSYTASATAATAQLQEVCDPVDNCDVPPQPDECPEDCFTCTEACGERCWTGATITVEYDLHSGECGVCQNAGPAGDDGCGRCCTLDGSTGGPDGTCFHDLQRDDCIAAGHFWWCEEPCIGEGESASTCSRLDFTGSIELTFTAIVGDEIHFQATLDAGDPIIVFDVWYDCTDERWYGRVTVNGHCVFEDDLNGVCTFFPGLPSLVGHDTDVPDSECTLQGSLSASDVTFLDFICPDEE